MDTMNIILTVFLVVMLLSFYFIPTFIALKRYHRNLVAIGFLNLFFGWTIIGWWGAFFWSIINGSDKP